MKKNFQDYLIAAALLALFFAIRFFIVPMTTGWNFISWICVAVAAICAATPAIEEYVETQKASKSKVAVNKAEVKDPFVEGKPEKEEPKANDTTAASEEMNANPPTPATEEAQRSPSITKKSIQACVDAADDFLVDAELLFRAAEKASDEAAKKMAEYEALLAAAKARRTKA